MKITPAFTQIGEMVKFVCCVELFQTCRPMDLVTFVTKGSESSDLSEFTMWLEFSTSWHLL
jgi:hypothetical protein